MRSDAWTAHLIISLDLQILRTSWVPITLECQPNQVQPTPHPHHYLVISEIWYRTKSGGPSIETNFRDEPDQHLSSSALSPAADVPVIHCDRFPRARYEPGTLSSGSAKSPRAFANLKDLFVSYRTAVFELDIFYRATNTLKFYQYLH